MLQMFVRRGEISACRWTSFVTLTFSQLESTPLYPCLGHEIPVTRKERKDVGGEKYSHSGGGDGNAGAQ